MNIAKQRVKAKYPTAHRRRVWAVVDGEHVRRHQIHVDEKRISVIFSRCIAVGATSAEAWENAQANLLSEVLQ